MKIIPGHRLIAANTRTNDSNIIIRHVGNGIGNHAPARKQTVFIGAPAILICKSGSEIKYTVR